MNTDQIKVLSIAIDTYGVDNQIEMIIEECSELIQAIQKLKRMKTRVNIGKIPFCIGNKENLIYANLCSEIADVKIMISQCEIIFNKEMINLSVDRKIERLSNNLLKSVK